MRTIRYLRVALESIAANKLRAALTMLGIIIGVAAVLTTLGIGSGAASSITAQIQSQGTNLLTVSAGASNGIGFGGAGGGASNGVTTLTMDDAAALANRAIHPEITLVVPDYVAQAAVTNAGQSSNSSVVGTTPAYATVRNLTLAEGRFFTDDEVRNSAPVAVLGATVATNLFPGADAVGQTVRINNDPIQVIGVLQSAGGAGFGSNDQRVFVPLSVAQDRLFNVPRYRGVYTISSMSIQVADASQMNPVQLQIEQTLRLRHGLPPTEDDDFTIFNQASLLQVANTVAQTLSIFLGSIGAVSLLVAGGRRGDAWPGAGESRGIWNGPWRSPRWPWRPPRTRSTCWKSHPPRRIWPRPKRIWPRPKPPWPICTQAPRPHSWPQRRAP